MDIAEHQTSDVSARCYQVAITRDWVCGSSGAGESEEDALEAALFTLGLEELDESDDKQAAQDDLGDEPSSLLQVLVQALQAGCLGALSVGLLDSLWLNRLNLLLPSPEGGVQCWQDLEQLIAKSVIDSIVYGGKSKVRNLEPNTLDPKPSALSPMPSALNPKPKAVNPGP